MNQSLYVIAHEFKAMVDKLENSELDQQTIKDTIEGESGALEVKATNVAMYVRNLESMAEQIKQAEQAMAERRKALENKSKQIKDYLLENMQYAGISKIESPYFTLSINKNPPSVIIDDESQLKVKFFTTPKPPEPAPDKTKIKAAIEAGEEVTGAHIESKFRLEIK